MSVHNYEHKISYFSVPKCACTSLKHLFFTIENGFEFRTYKANGHWMHIHNAAYATKKFGGQPHARIQDHWKIAVVRDPLERVLSCYSNRVLHHGELDTVELSDEDRELGMRRRPDLPTFVEHLGRYRKRARSIEHHTRPMTAFLGRDAGYFDRLYNMAELSQLVADVAERVGDVQELSRRQTGGPKFTLSDLDGAQKKKLKRLFSKDYEVFGKHLSTQAEPAPSDCGAVG